MKRKGIQPTLQTRIREYLNFIWKEEKQHNFDEENKIVESLSLKLREELMFDAYGLFLNQNPLFKNNFSQGTLKKLVFSMKEILFNPGDKIFSVFILFIIYLFI